MVVTLHEIEMDQQAKETQEFINEDRSTHDLNMEDFGIKIQEGQQTFQQYFEKVKQNTALAVSTVFLWTMLTTEEFNSLPRDVTSGNIKFFGWFNKTPQLRQDDHHVYCCCCNSYVYVSPRRETCDEPTSSTSFYVSLVYNN